MTSEDKNWAAAKQYVLDPLTAPQPSDETGPGTSFRPESERSSRAVTPPQLSRTGRNGAAKVISSTATEVTSGYPSPPHSGSPRRTPPSHRQEAFGEQGHRRRSSSLGERFPGDMSHRPLDQLSKEKAVADKARHITKKHHIQPDTIDLLDGSAAGGAYHHGGPYDATLFARNNSYESSPVKAVSASNAEAIRATPREKIVDSLERHRPLDGVAAYPPGDVDPNGHTYRYREGENMMVDGDPEGGAYKRWPGVQYHPDDIKGKGEPSYTLEMALKKDHGDAAVAAEEGTEMTTRDSKPRGDSLGQALKAEGYESEENQMRRSGSFGKRLSGGFRKRLSGIKKATGLDD